MLAMQMWIAIRWRSFVVPLGVGLAGAMAAVIFRVAPPRFLPLTSLVPWAQPFVAFYNPQIEVFAAAVGGCVVVAVAGCWDVFRRDVV